MDLFRSKRIILRFPSENFEIKWQNLEKAIGSRLYRIRYAKTLQELTRLCDNFDIQTNEIYFNRSSVNFLPIIDYYRTNKLHLHINYCPTSMKAELVYWNLHESLFEKCCLLRYALNSDHFNELKDSIHILTCEIENEEILENNKPSSVQEKLWDIFENPNARHSRSSKVNSFL